eukprot:12002131-Karenia_brevis.AAC.1
MVSRVITCPRPSIAYVEVVLHLSRRADLDQLVADARRTVGGDVQRQRYRASHVPRPPLEPRDDAHVLYFDGACEENPGPGAAGA